jgi:sigma-B regulation protein RsbU (phosphoserine phosphatase)
LSNDADHTEEDFIDLFENAPCGYVVLRPDGRVAKTNLTLCRWAGYAPEELIGKRLIDILNVAGRIFYETHFAPLLRMQGFFHEVALDIVKKNGEAFSVLVNAAERRDAEGKVLCVRVAIFNATDRRRYERDLLKVHDSQHAEAELREHFIAVLGHDLRNPLGAISAGTQLLQRAGVDANAQEIVLMMQKSVMRMASLIDNILDFARGRLGAGITLNLSSEPLGPTLQQVVDELQSTHPEAIIKTDLALTRTVPADAERIGQLLSNLLGNALTYGALNEPITVTAKTEGQFELAVCNAGEQIAPATMGRLFLPFSRGEVRASQQGLGLGLYIASEIAKAHGGEILVTSTPEKTCFRLLMPLER